MSEIHDALRLHLLQCGFVDPDDDTVPIFTGNDPHFAWTSVDKLVDALLARFEIGDRQAPHAPRVFFPGETVPADTGVMDETGGGGRRFGWDWVADYVYVEYWIPNREEWQALVDRARAEREES